MINRMIFIDDLTKKQEALEELTVDEENIKE